MTVAAEPLRDASNKEVSPRRCSGTTKCGEPCGAPESLLRDAGDGSYVCVTHDPEISDEERRAFSRLGGLRQAARMRRHSFLDGTDLPALKTPEDAQAFAELVARGAATGRLSASAANAAIRALERWHAAFEGVDLARRLGVLEQAEAERKVEAEHERRARATRPGGSEYITREVAS